MAESLAENPLNFQQLALQSAEVLRRYFPKYQKKDELKTKLFRFIRVGEKKGVPVAVSLDEIFLKLEEGWQLGEEMENNWQKVVINDQEIGIAKKIIPFNDRAIKIPEGYERISYLSRVRDEQAFWPLLDTILKVELEPENFRQSMAEAVFGGVDFYAFSPVRLPL